jgi:predicted glycogen debranching enzyme
VAGLSRRIDPRKLDDAARRGVLEHEWLVTNGLGGYASGTLSGVATRRYHGLLIAALPAPLGRWMLLSHLVERLRLPDGTLVPLGGAAEGGAAHLAEFRLELGMPVWRYEIGPVVIEKHVVLLHDQNTVHVVYRQLEGSGPCRLKLRVCVQNRSHDAEVDAPLAGEFRLVETGGRFEIAPAGAPPLRLALEGRRSAFTIEHEVLAAEYSHEAARGYPYRGLVWSPGYFRVDLTPDAAAALVATTESWEAASAVEPAEAAKVERGRRARLLDAAPIEARDGLAGELVLAADQFLVKPVGRTEDAARVHAEGGEIRTVIAGYHWFTDWGRDTMISLEGLTLATGRVAEAGYILRMFAHYIRDGLLPNMFPEGERTGVYHTADATLWFFHALDRYVARSGDEETLRLLVPSLVDIAQRHVEGTRFGIGVDPEDGLLRQGAESYQLTWMDAKVGDWVVTPRRGKAVEINALWYNALCLLEGWLRGVGRDVEAEQWARRADAARASFNRRFWNESEGCLYDVVDGEHGNDAAVRPNQLIAISLESPVLEPARWRPVVEVVQRELLTPFGLRSLSPRDRDYHARYDGDRRARDAAYHQGTVWPWLLGPFVDAWLKVHPGEQAAARKFLSAFDRHLAEAAVGTISEIFDAEPPFTPRGCVAQAWSVAEVLRCWLATEPPAR